MSGYNLPDGVREGDPRAPWNEVAKGECETCESWFECGPGGVCELDFEKGLEVYLGKDSAPKGDDAPGMAAWWALSWSLTHMDDEGHEACDKWREAW